MIGAKLSAYPPASRGQVHRLAIETQRQLLNVAVGPGGKYGRLALPDQEPAVTDEPSLGEEIIAWGRSHVPRVGVLIGQPMELMDWQKREILRL